MLEWIRQCEITFESEGTLRKLLHPDVWPHASRASFVELLREKAMPTGGVALDRAVGLRLTFRQPPPIDCFSSQFLFYLNSTVADTAYHTWSQNSCPLSAGSLPLRRAETYASVNLGGSAPSFRFNLASFQPLRKFGFRYWLAALLLVNCFLAASHLQLALHLHGDDAEQHPLHERRGTLKFEHAGSPPLQARIQSA